MTEASKRIDSVLQKHKINLTDQQAKALAQYITLLQKWSRVFNLTSILDWDDILDLHIVDSAIVLPFVRGRRILDVGTGAGLPGMVLAILSPQWQFYLLDSNNKKTRFLQQCCMEIGLKNIQVIHTRVENYQPEKSFDSIISRAFSSLDVFVDKSTRLLATGGVLLAMKGKQSGHNSCFKNAQWHHISSMREQRHLVQIQQKDL